MPLCKYSIINKTTISLVATMFCVSAMPMDFNQTQRLAYQGDAMSQSKPDLMYYKGQRERKNYIESAESYQKFTEQGDVRAHNRLCNKDNNGQNMRQDYIKASELH